MAKEPTAASNATVIDDDTRRIAVTAVAAAAIAWWPAFTLGVYRVVFFEQQFALWAASTTVFLIASLTLRQRAWRRPAMWSLLLPSLWLAIAWVLPVGGTSVQYRVVFWFGVVVTILGMPAMAALLVRLLVPGAGRLRGRPALTAIGVVLVVVIASYVLGTQHSRILTCEDFTISGNFAPEGCSPGTGSTVFGAPDAQTPTLGENDTQEPAVSLGLGLVARGGVEACSWLPFTVLDIRNGPNLGLGNIEYRLVLPTVEDVTVIGPREVDAKLDLSKSLGVHLATAGDINSAGIDVTDRSQRHDRRRRFRDPRRKRRSATGGDLRPRHLSGHRAGVR